MGKKKSKTIISWDLPDNASHAWDFGKVIDGVMNKFADHNWNAYYKMFPTTSFNGDSLKRGDLVMEKTNPWAGPEQRIGFFSHKKEDTGEYVILTLDGSSQAWGNAMFIVLMTAAEVAKLRWIGPFTPDDDKERENRVEITLEG